MSCRFSFFVELYRKNGDPDTYSVSHRALHFSPRHLVFPSLTPARFFICSIMKTMGIRLVVSCASVRLVVVVVKFVFSHTIVSNHIFLTLLQQAVEDGWLVPISLPFIYMDVSGVNELPL